MYQVIDVKAISLYIVWLKFNNGEEVEIDLSEYFTGKGMTKDLISYEKFSNVKLDETGGITWENGFDFCPVLLKEISEKQAMKFSLK